MHINMLKTTTITLPKQSDHVSLRCYVFQCNQRLQEVGSRVVLCRFNLCQQRNVEKESTDHNQKPLSRY